MTIIWKDTTLKLHGKRHKRDRYYFRWHYGKQRRVWISKEYVDRPTEKQVSAREAFTALRREVARQLRDAELRAAWMRRFEADNEGYKMLHTYVYAKLKASPLQLPPRGESDVTAEEQKFRSTEVRRFGRGCVVDEGDAINGVSTARRESNHALLNRETHDERLLIVHNGFITPIFLPSKVPRRMGVRCCWR